MGAEKAVLVTGASTGLGHRITQQLSKEGFYVYAGARKDRDLIALECLPNVRALRLDVTKLNDIAAAAETVTNAGRGLHALINNAGITTYSPVVSTCDDELDSVMRTNVYGPYRVTRAFLPLLTLGQGRIIIMGSIAGILAQPNLSAYSMSKHAIEALTDSLAAELEPRGVSVSVIEPGASQTDLVKNAIRRGREAARPQSALGSCKLVEPEEIARVVVSTLREPRPRRRYLVANEDETRLTLEKQIAQLVQMNEGSLHRYDRRQLIQMLDEALTKGGPSSAARPDSERGDFA
jgi:NAD(P)-dependent dehydrogenase (short-subunit alcohol dehydrogenase family)